MLESELEVAADVFVSFIELLVREILFHQWICRNAQFGSSGLFLPLSWANVLADRHRHGQVTPNIPPAYQYLQVIESVSLSLRFGRPGEFQMF
jgi:hypothetical protein